MKATLKIGLSLALCVILFLCLGSMVMDFGKIVLMYVGLSILALVVVFFALRGAANIRDRKDMEDNRVPVKGIDDLPEEQFEKRVFLDENGREAVYVSGKGAED